MQILSKFFPPRLPSPVRDWEPPADRRQNVESWCGNVQPKKYANGIERYFAEEAEARCQKYFGGSHMQYMAQLINSEKEMQRHVAALVAAGYVNIHDEWFEPFDK